MSMSWEELRKQAYQLSVSDRLLLVEAIIHSLNNELQPRPSVPPEVWERLRGSLKTENSPPTDDDIAAMLQERLEEKYL